MNFDFYNFYLYYSRSEGWVNSVINIDAYYSGILKIEGIIINRKKNNWYMPAVWIHLCSTSCDLLN